MLWVQATPLEKTGGSDADADILLRIVETRSGAILDELQGLAGGLMKDAESLNALIDSAVAKAEAPLERRRYVGLMPFRSEEANTSLDRFARSLMALIRHDLQRSSGLVVLEREQLRRLQTESTLTGMEQQLRSSAVLVECGLRHDDSGRFVVANLRFVDLSSGQASQAQCQATTADGLAGLREQILRAAAGPLLSQGQTIAAGDAKTEADLFRRRGLALMDYSVNQLVTGRILDAADCIEVAVALDPSQANLQAGFDIYRKAYLDTNSDRSAAPLQHLDVVVRLAELDEQYLRGAIAESSGDLRHLKESYSLDRLFVGGPPQKFDVNDQQQRESFNRVRAHGSTKYSMLLAEYERIGEPATDDVVRLMSERMAVTALLADSAVDYSQQIEDLIGQIQSKLPSQPIPSFIYFLRESISGSNRCPTWRDSSSQVPLAQWLQQQDSPILQLMGQYCLVESAERNQSREAAEALLRTVLDPQSPLNVYLADETDVALASMGNGGRNPGSVGLEWAVDRTAEMSSSSAIWRLVNEGLDKAEQAHNAIALVRWSGLVLDAVHQDQPAEQSEGFCRRLVDVIEQSPPPKQFNEFASRLKKIAEGRLAELAEKSQPPHTPWDDYDTVYFEPAFSPGINAIKHLSIITGPDGRPQLEMICQNSTADSGGNPPLELVLVRSDVDGQSVKEFSRCAVSHPEIGDRLVRVAKSGSMIVAATFFDGLMIFDDKQVRTLREAQGAPSDKVTSLAIVDGKVYVGYPNCLASFDPATMQWEIVASARAVNPKTPLDAAGGFDINELAADEAHHVLWLAVGGTRPYIGLWKYTPQTGEFNQVSDADASPGSLSWRNGHLFIYPSWDTPCEVHLESDTIERMTFAEQAKRVGWVVGDQTILWPYIYDGKGNEYAVNNHLRSLRFDRVDESHFIMHQLFFSPRQLAHVNRVHWPDNASSQPTESRPPGSQTTSTEPAKPVQAKMHVVEPGPFRDRGGVSVNVHAPCAATFQWQLGYKSDVLASGAIRTRAKGGGNFCVSLPESRQRIELTLVLLSQGQEVDRKNITLIPSKLLQDVSQTLDAIRVGIVDSEENPSGGIFWASNVKAKLLRTSLEQAGFDGGLVVLEGFTDSQLLAAACETFASRVNAGMTLVVVNPPLGWEGFGIKCAGISTPTQAKQAMAEDFGSVLRSDDMPSGTWTSYLQANEAGSKLLWLEPTGGGDPIAGTSGAYPQILVCPAGRGRVAAICPEGYIYGRSDIVRHALLAETVLWLLKTRDQPPSQAPESAR